MKANELMIGDWVLDTYTNKPMRVEGINTFMGEGLEPIPLEADILCKNFEEREDFNVFYLYDDYTEVHISEYTDGLWEVVVDEVEMSGLPTWKMYVANVHQLQHALRLANVDIEIKL